MSRVMSEYFYYEYTHANIPSNGVVGKGKYNWWVKRRSDYETVASGSTDTFDAMMAATDDAVNRLTQAQKEFEETDEYQKALEVINRKVSI